MTTADEVSCAWAEIAARFDPTEGYPEAEAMLRNAAEHDDSIATAINHMRLVDETEGKILGQMDYGFCLERKLWRRGGEAYLQARALQQILFWAANVPADRVALKRIVVRHTFYPNFNYATPTYTPYAGIQFIVVPQVYQEVLHLPAAALWEAYSGQPDSSAWSLLDEPQAAVTRSTKAPLSFRRLVARILTSDAADPNIEGENPVSNLSRTSLWFAGIDETRVTSPLETALAYSGQDFALAHEIGHGLIGGVQPDRLELETEIAADSAGFRLFAASWGWRDEVLEGCPLSSGARTLLGPIWFCRTATIIHNVRQQLGARISSSIRCDTGFINFSQDRKRVEILSLRWGKMRQTLAAYAQQVLQLVGGITPEDVARLGGLLVVLDSLESRVGEWLHQLPDSDLLAAVLLIRPDADMA